MALLSAKKFGEFLKKKRMEKELTQEKLGEIIGVSSFTISKWERGVSFPNFEMEDLLAEALDITLAEMHENAVDESSGRVGKIIEAFATLALVGIIIAGIFSISDYAGKRTALSNEAESSRSAKQTAEKKSDKAKTAEEIIQELDLPESIKDVFLENGKIVTASQNITTLKDYKVADFTACEKIGVLEKYVVADMDEDGKNEIACTFYPELSIILNEEDDGRVYIYELHSAGYTVRKNGCIYSSISYEDESDMIDMGVLHRIKFDKGKRVNQGICTIEKRRNEKNGKSEVKCEIEGKTVEEDEYYKYLDEKCPEIKWKALDYFVNSKEQTKIK